MTTISLPLPAAPASPPSAAAAAAGTAPAGLPADAATEGDGTPQEFAELLAALVAPIAAQVPAAAPLPEVAPDLTLAGAAPDVPVVGAAAMATILSAASAATVTAATPEAAATVPAPARVVATAAQVVVEETAPDIAPAAGPETVAAADDQEPVAAITDGDLPEQPATAPQLQENVTEQSIAAAARNAVDDEAPVLPEASTAAAVATDAAAATPTDAADAPAPQPAVTTPSVQRTQQVAPAAPADAPTPARPVPAAEQVAVAVTPLLRREDGSFHLSLRLHPEELGGVNVEVELRNGEVNLTMRADGEAGREALRSSLQSLRSELEAAGVRAGSLDVGDGAAGERGGDGATARHDRAPSNGQIDALIPSVDDLEASLAADAALDVRM